MTWPLRGGSTAALLLTTLIVLLGATACPRSGGQSSEDIALAQSVHDQFQASSDLKGATSRVLVEAKDGTVWLKGTTDTAADKALAESVAQGTKNVVRVVNEIAVSGGAGVTGHAGLDAAAVRAKAEANGERIGEAFDDVRIYAEVRRKVVLEPATPRKDIFVDVENGDVTLRGMVFSQEARDEAVRAAKQTEGVKAVRDLLKVNAPGL